MVAQGFAVARFDHHAAGEIFRIGGVRVGGVAHARGEIEDGSVGKRALLQFGQTKAAQHQTRCRDELHAELRIVVVGRFDLVGVGLRDDVDGRFRYQRLHRHDVFGLEVMFFAQHQRGIGAGVDQVADRIRLDGDFAGFPAFAQPGGDGAVIHLVLQGLQVALIQTKAAFVGFARPHITIAREVRGSDARHAGPARMQALVPCAFFEKLLTRGGGAADHALRHGQLLGVQPVQPTRLQRT